MFSKIRQSNFLRTITSWIRARTRSLIAALRALPEQGLWSYTPDPAPPGRYRERAISGETPPHPAWLVGNSRHQLKQLNHHLEPLGLPIITLDTGGLDLYLAHAAGRLTPQTLGAALRTIDAQVGETAETGETKRALLPYPIWTALGGERLGGVGGWEIEPGPANARDAVTFLARGQLGDEMKIRRVLLQQRLHLVLAHAAFFLLVAAAPLLLLGGWPALAVGALITLVTALTGTLLWHLLSGRLTKTSPAG